MFLGISRSLSVNGRLLFLNINHVLIYHPIHFSGGTGKTFCINTALADLRSKGNIALCAATSGIAATLLSGGATAHSMFKIPLDLQRQEMPRCNISKQSELAKVLKLTSLIVWDEATMAHLKTAEALDRTLQDICSNKRPFGGE